NVSPNPCVVSSPVLGPVRVISVLSATVQAWKKNFVALKSSSASARPRLRAASPTASTAPTAKSSGVDSALPKVTAPCSSIATQSVNVPPISTPTMYSMTSPRMVLASLARKIQKKSQKQQEH